MYILTLRVCLAPSYQIHYPTCQTPSYLSLLLDLLVNLPFLTPLDWCSPSHWLLPKVPAPSLCSAETEIRLCCLSVKMTEHTPDNAAHSTAWAGPSSLFSGHSLHPDDFLASFQTLVLTYSILLAAFVSPFFFPPDILSAPTHSPN